MNLAAELKHKGNFCNLPAEASHTIYTCFTFLAMPPPTRILLGKRDSFEFKLNIFQIETSPSKIKQRLSETIKIIFCHEKFNVTSFEIFFIHLL